jgi:hypothetical protein
MSIVQGQTTAFKANVLSGLENFTLTSPYTYKIALYTALANLNNTTAAYTPVGEVATGNGYTAGGIPLTISNPPTQDTANNVAWISFNNATWPNSSITARGALIYNSNTGASIFVLNFGSDITMNNFTVTFPTPTSTTAVLTIS